MNKEQIKDWADFYGRLAAVAAVNGLVCFGYVLFGAVVAQEAKLVDLRSVEFAGLGWTLAGTVLASVLGALYKHPLPEPKEPGA